MDRDSLTAEKRNNLSTIAGLKNRIDLSQEEIDALTARNAVIDAQSAPSAAAQPETPPEEAAHA